MATPCTNPIGFVGTTAWDVVPNQLAWFTNIANQYIQAANTFTQELASFDIIPIDIQSVTWNINAGFTPFALPAEPADFQPPAAQFTTQEPTAPILGIVDTSGLNVPFPPVSAPAVPPLNIPAPPVVSLPTLPVEPTIDDVDIPTYSGPPLPDVPTLEQLNLPDEPDINLGDLDVDRPDFIYPNALQDTYRYDFQDFRSLIWTGVDAEVDATGVTDMHARLQAMLAGGTGLPANIEQALFDRAIGREEVSSEQAVAQAEQEWAAKGFDLPGSSLLARVQEIRQANRIERGRVNRELSIQFHTQEIENLRFSVQQAIGLEGTLLEAHSRIYDIARQLADGHWEVVRGIYDSAVNLFRLQLEIYRTDVEVFKEKLEIELAKLQVYRSQLEAQRLITDINKNIVDIYTAELQGVLASVDIFRAEVEAANAQIRAELGKIEIFKGRIDAYTATIAGERVKYDIYGAQVDAEQAKASIYATQVDAYGKRIDAYRTEVSAESTKVDANLRVQESQTRIYSEQVDAWRTGIDADIRNLEALVEVHRANLQKYTALLSAEQYRVTGEARNFELEIERERAKVASELKIGDQRIEQLKHISQMSLSATEIASKVNSQLAASAMAAIDVGARLTASNQLSASDDRSCRTNYSGTV